MCLLKEALIILLDFKVFPLVCCGVITILVIFENYYKYRGITTKVTTFYGLPLVGNIFEALPPSKFLYKMGSYFNKSLTFFTWIGLKPFIVTIDPDVIKHILNSEEFLNKANVLYRSMDNAMPSGLITSKFFKWKHDRKLMNPSFSPQVLQRFIPIFIRNTDNICQHFDSLLDGKEHGILSFLQKSIMEVALETIMGLELKLHKNLSSEMERNIHLLLEKICLQTALTPTKLSYFVRHSSSYYKILEYLHTTLKKLISFKNAQPLDNEGGEFFLNRALKYQKQGLFSTEDVITQTYTMITASYETTSTALYSMIVMLAMHPDVQERLYQDVVEIIVRGDQITYDHLEQLPYLNMVISETLRLVPPVTFIGRQTLENSKLMDGVTLPRDFEVLISIFHLHRCQTFWGSDAHKFNPDNFLTARVEERHPYAYLPYSKGMRNCIGWRHADLALKFLLLGLIRRYKFTTSFPYEDLYFIQKISLQYLKEPKIQISLRS